MINDARCANDLQARGDFVNGGTAPVSSRSEVWGVAGTANIRLTDALAAKIITAYRVTESRGVRDGDNTPLLLITTDVAAKSRQFSHEVQLQYSQGSVDALLGGYYFNERTNERSSVSPADQERDTFSTRCSRRTPWRCSAKSASSPHSAWS